MGRSWGRLYANTRNHHKIVAIRRLHPRYWKAIYPLMEMSFETDDNGKVQISPGQPYSLKDLAKEIDESPRNLEKLLQDLVRFEIISYQENTPIFLSYNERQFVSDIDGIERTRRWRDKKKEGSVTSQKRHCDGTEAEAEAEAEAYITNTPPPPLKLSRKKTKKIVTDYADDFLAWYDLYPNKVNKAEASKIWELLRQDNLLPPLNILIEALELQKSQSSWRDNNGKYIPYPNNWLEKQRWTDIIKSPNQNFTPAMQALVDWNKDQDRKEETIDVEPADI